MRCWIQFDDGKWQLGEFTTADSDRLLHIQWEKKDRTVTLQDLKWGIRGDELMVCGYRSTGEAPYQYKQDIYYFVFEDILARAKNAKIADHSRTFKKIGAAVSRRRAAQHPAATTR